MRRTLFQTAAATMVLDASQYETFIIALGTSVQNLAIKNISPGQLYVFVLKQNGKGSHTLNWSGNANNAMPIDPRPNSVSVQCFIGMDDGVLQSNIPGTWSDE